MKINKFFNFLDQISEKGISFFFVIDFLKENFIFKYLNDLILSKDILVEFPQFFNYKKQYKENIILYPKFISFNDFYSKFTKIHKEICIGNSYLTNLTFKIPLKNKESLFMLFNSAESKYKLLIKDYFVCFSPETFIKIIDNEIFTYPMKGTIDFSIRNAKNILMESEKERAEHATIVDLLRNDLNIVSEKVKLIKFRYLEKIKSSQKIILQTSSEIKGKLMKKYHNKIGTILSLILPAGSISGAPKRKTLEIIQSTEVFKRGFYTGVAGIFDGKNLDSCVLIRFIEKENNQLFYKTGSGIHYLSDPKNEFIEIKNKIYVPVF